MPEFNHRDPLVPDFWTERFEKDFMPWDRGAVPQALQRFVAQSPRPLVTLIPGCGAGYEVACLAAAGWEVTAIDFSPAAVAAAQAVLGPLASNVRQADFFQFEPDGAAAAGIELIYERAFLCALPARMWPNVAARWAHLLAPGGLLAGFFFFDDKPKGPPFGIAPAALDELLSADFERIDDQAVEDSIPVFAGKERWQVWRRRESKSGQAPARR